MKKSQKILKDNRGVALITVMIAVAFISILASTLLYMSYSNFKMKVVNYESKVNFYETERDLTTITTGIRNKIANATDPMADLKTAVGYYEVAPGVARYNPDYLAKFIDSAHITNSGPTLGLKETAVTLSCADGDSTFVTNAVTPTNANFVIYEYMNPSDPGFDPTNPMYDATIGPDEKKIVLKGVQVKHTEAKSGYVNTLTTDIVFRVKETPSNASPGGVGEFSVLMDSPIGGTSAAPTRITFYGNSFVGPGTYTYDVSGKIAPSDATALHLGGNAYFAQKGDYMIVFGDILLEGQSVLNVSGGTLTVFGDIILKDNAALICSGDVYQMKGCSITQPLGKSNVIPAELTTTNKPKEITDASYEKVIKLLKLDDANDSNNDDGILNQIMKSDFFDLLNNPNVQQTEQTSSSTNLFGVDYSTMYFTSKKSINGTDADAALCIVNSTGAELQDGANRNTTFVCLKPLIFSNEKAPVLTQMGSAVFNHFIDGTNSDVAALNFFEGNGVNQNHQIKPSDMFESTCNKTVNDLINHSTNDASGVPQIDTAVGYANWTKE